MEGMRRWVFPVEPAELVEILNDHSVEKQGPFAWPARDEHNRPALFLDLTKRSRKGGFRCTVRAIRYWTPASPFARGSVHIITLRISKARGSYASVIMTCRKPDTYGDACQHFATEMDKLLAELTASLLQVEQGVATPGMTGIPAQEAPTGSDVDNVNGRAEDAEPLSEWDTPRVGHPGLDHDELIYRLAKAQEAEELKQANKHMTWRWIAQEIKWNKGRDNAGLALLRDARQRLHRLAPGDPLLAEVAAWRGAKETKET